MNRRERRTAKGKSGSPRKWSLRTDAAIREALTEAGGDLDRASAIFQFKADAEILREIIGKDKLRQYISEHVDKLLEDRPDLARDPQAAVDEVLRMLRARSAKKRQ